MANIKKWNSYNIFTMDTDIVEFNPTNLFYLSKLKLNKFQEIDLKEFGINTNFIVRYTDYGFCVSIDNKEISYYLISHIWNSRKLELFKEVVYNSKSLEFYGIEQFWKEVMSNSPKSPYCFIFNEACNVIYKRELKGLKDILDYIIYFTINKRA